MKEGKGYKLLRKRYRRHALTIFHITAPIETNKASSIFIKKKHQAQNVLYYHSKICTLFRNILKFHPFTIITLAHTLVLSISYVQSANVKTSSPSEDSKCTETTRNLFRVYNLFSAMTMKSYMRSS